MSKLVIRKDLKWRQAPEELPNIENEDSMACLVLCNGSLQINYWNQYYQCWDTSDGDDYEMSKESKIKWIPLEEYES